MKLHKRKGSTKVYPKSPFFKPRTRKAGFKRELTPVGNSLKGTRQVDIMRQTTYRDKYGHIRRRVAVKIDKYGHARRV